MTLSAKGAVTVAELNQYIKSIVSEDDRLSALWVRGEISNLKYHSSGHIYFSLKDSSSLIKCVMFRSRSVLLKFRLTDGMKVLVFGSVDVFERDGVYQLYAECIEPEGLGSLYAAFERLKAGLEAEGLFDLSHKRRIPLLPGAVGVVTSPTGAVIQDITNITRRRFAEMPLILYPTPVQGKGAAPLIAEAIEKAAAEGKCDVIIVARGGGSLEDLWPFNEECVARAIYSCPIPVISAVGHETDYTIADFTADLRAPTPSAAAELAVPEKAALKLSLSELKIRLFKAPGGMLLIKRKELDGIKSFYGFKRPAYEIERRRRNIEQCGMRLDMSFSAVVSDKRAAVKRFELSLKTFNAESAVIRKRAELENLIGRLIGAQRYNKEQWLGKVELLGGKLSALGPDKVLSRGYAIIFGGDGQTVSSVNDIDVGESFEIMMHDGRMGAVKEK